MCLIGTKSENGRLGRLRKAGGFADFGEIFVSICEILKTTRICSRCYGKSLTLLFAAKHQTRLRVFQLEPRGSQMILKLAVLQNFVFDWKKFKVYIFRIWKV